ncbi:Na+/H+ antiporter subunit A [Streptomyces spiroverticillatus]|uniref:Na+/H+ antiporter subunit A n=1 Tax=Streptomyces finlayi TaxID=67296 RepID=A0A918WU18_9ACTN|nr:Na+/H+ antiporter subunit A [Streptomyces finlayi]GGZ98059.1 Na+/H+ antiporter subunit A [Streptomyces spiroverticillatus]GHC83030.1 Na+/H+ antiporter subunit A [Streptomyces finlayi]
MTFLVLAHFVVALCAAPLVRRTGPRAFVLLAVPPAVALGWALSHWGEVVDGKPAEEAWTWIEGYGVEVAFRLDALSLLMVLLAAGIGALVLLYCVSYFEAGEPRLGPFGGQLLGFAGAMLGLVLADDLMVLYLFWELTTVLSFLLIGYDSEKRGGRRSALQALTVTTVGGLAMFVGFLMVGEEAGTYRISKILDQPPAPSTALSVALVLILCGAIAKSAIWPLSLWLPNAMAAPTPVSAYLHAAAMVKAGVYLVARLAPAFAEVTPWRPLLLTLGSATLLLGGWHALRQNDLKLVLAYGTVSQLGFLVVLAGAGSYNTGLAAVAMILGHALFKAPLFLVTGIVDHATGTRDLRKLSGVGRALPWVCAVAVVAGMSMIALPPMLGFVAKEAAFEALLEGTAGERWVLALVVLGSALTTAYTLRFLWGAFARKPGLPDTHVHRVSAAFLAPPALLALACLVLGPGIGWPAGLFERYAAQYPVPEQPYHLALWHGFGTTLGLSALAWALGTALFLLREPVARLGSALAWPSAERAFDGTVLGLERASLQLTGYVQKGSLPAYVATVLGVMVWGLLAVLAVDRPWQDSPPAPRLWDSPWQAVVAVLTCACALLCLRVQRRMQAAVLAGLTGYGTALLYVVHGAPDLALTQFGVETVSTVVLVLVLRRLPLFFGDPVQRRHRRMSGLVIALVSSLVAAVAVWLAAAARTGTPIGAAMVEATAEHGLKDVVATILVDFRAWDTLGESAVLAAAVAGVTSLLFTDSGQEDPDAPGAWRRYTPPEAVRAEHEPSPYDLAAPERSWLAAGGATDPRHRSVVFEVVARLIFHPILMLSVYLLFCAENLPGGGFVGGLVAGIALTIRYLAGGRHELEAATGFHAGFFVGLGLALSTTVALAGLFFGGTVLHSWSWHGHLPLIGEWHAGTSVLFDIGVYFLVTGVVLDTVRAIGAWMDQGAENEVAARASARPLTPEETS